VTALFNRIVLTSLLLAIFVAGCATFTPDLPSITDNPTNARHTGKIVWHDLLTNTPEESRKFYSELFGWEFESPGIDLGFGDESSYMLIRHKGVLIGGMVDTNALNKKDNVSQWVTMMSVEDIQSSVTEVAVAGGKVLTPPTELKSRGMLAIVEDPTGAIFALIQTKDGDPADHEPAHNNFFWDELWTDDVERASNFYHFVVGYEREDRPIENTDRSYHLLKKDEQFRAGIMANPFEGERPVWVNYIRVEDPAAITARVEGLGGNILVEAQERDIGGKVAFIAGPSGAGIALQTWPLK
jgi:predicted enzyme related to lactoylglutathione lyase